MREPRSDFESLRWTITSRSSPMRASKPARNASTRLGLGQVDPGAPGMRRVEAEPGPGVGRCPAPASASAIAASSSRSTPRPNPPPAEFSSTNRTDPAPSSASARTRARARRPAGRCPSATEVSRCEPMWTFRKRAVEPGRRPQVAGQDLDGPARRSHGSGPARLTRYEAWIATGPMPQLGEPLAEGRRSAGGSGRRRQAVGLSPKTWMRGRPDRVTLARRPCPSPDATDRWAPSRRPSGSTDASYDAGTMPHDTDQPVPRRPRPEPGIGPAGETLPPEVAKVLRSFFRDDRLTTIPANAAEAPDRARLPA